MRSKCPNLDCQAGWGIEEMSFQECDTCGWPNVWPEDEDEEYFEPCSQCDGHPACEDSGCAHSLGVGHLVKTDPSQY